MVFDEILAKTLKWEGHDLYTDDPIDLGSATKFGITIATLCVWRKRQVSKDEVRTLTREEAIEIYQTMYFKQPLFHLLPECLQGPVFDFGVNAGPGRAVKSLQTLCNKIGAGGVVSVDGGLGPFTLKAVQTCLDQVGETTMVNAYQDERQNFYNAIVANNPSQSRFIHGWTNRANDFRIPG